MPTLRKLHAASFFVRRRHHSSLSGQSPTCRCAQQRSGMRSQGDIEDGSDSHMPVARPSPDDRKNRAILVGSKRHQPCSE